MMLRRQDKVGIVCCSNGLSDSARPAVMPLENALKELGLKPVFSRYLYAGSSVFDRTGRQRAGELMEFYRNPGIRAVFDISGGDLANEVLTNLDFQVIREHLKPFFGYSDLTVIVNAVFQQTGRKSYLYQVRNLVMDHSEEQKKNFKDSLLGNGNGLFQFRTRLIRGTSMEGMVVGGNIRCLLKLAGTPFWPDMQDKILFLESRGGEVPQMVTYLNQLKQIGVFEQVNGILLGTFTAMEAGGCLPRMEELVENTAGLGIPIAKTEEIGHGTDSKCLIIGKKYRFGV